MCQSLADVAFASKRRPCLRVELACWTRFDHRPLLTLADQVHEFDPRDGSCAGAERFETQRWPHCAFDGSMVLLLRCC